MPVVHSAAMPRIAVFVKMEAKPGRRDDLVAGLAPLLAAAEDEAGTEVYVLHTSDDEPDVVRFYEQYPDADAMAAHSKSDTMREAGMALADLLTGRPEIFLTTPVQGKGLPIAP